jgi:hypothetical protein
MKNYFALRQKPVAHNFKPHDVLVLFGELFNRGYANGLVEEAEKNGMLVIRATVGRRDTEQNLRALTAEETALVPNLINIPLEAGFDLEKDENGKSPVDYLKEIKLSTWQQAAIPEASLKLCREKGRERFRLNTRAFLKELEAKIQDRIQAGAHVHFAHLMAGGVPRCKIVMPLMNRVFKGIGERYLSSESFWNSGIGQFLAMNFHEVTAETFNILMTESQALREKIAARGGHCSAVAYGYHGTEIMIQNGYQWQSYAPYIQGWAKVALENYSREWSARGAHCCVYNCPEILTNSSSIFQGVEIPLYNLIRAFEKEAPAATLTGRIREQCKAALKDDSSIEQVFALVDRFLTSKEFLATSVYENWPQHSRAETLALSLETSDAIIALHRDEKSLMTATLSELIFKACGYIMLHEAYSPQSPVAWIGHDVVARTLTADGGLHEN